jgi:hypothetical protein
VKAELRRFGTSQSPVVVIDEFSGDPEGPAGIAQSLVPFPAESASYYPGVRRLVDERDGQAFEYMQHCCREAAQFIAGAFDVEGFDLIRASFSMVTTQPSNLSPAQRAPHFDSTDQNYFALLHYLRVPPDSGTAFYRQRSTGIERVTKSNLDQFVRTAKADAAKLPADSGYILGSDEYFEEIGAVEAVADRMIIYQGSLLHSGIIPRGMNFSVDPREGRLTANLFVQGY